MLGRESGFGDPIRLHDVFVREVERSPFECREKAS